MVFQKMIDSATETVARVVEKSKREPSYLRMDPEVGLGRPVPVSNNNEDLENRNAEFEKPNFKAKENIVFDEALHEGSGGGAVVEGRQKENGSKLVRRTSARMKKKKEKDSAFEKMEEFHNGRAVTAKRTKMTKSNGNAKQCVIKEEASVSRADSGHPAVASKRKRLSKTDSKEESSMMNPIARRVMEAADGSAKMLGAHVSVAGGLEQSFYNALSIGCRSFAFFVRNQRSWNSPPMKDEVVQKFRQTAKELKFPMDQIVVHGSYLINGGSSDAEILKRARACMLDECKRCEQLGIIFYNIHPGSTAGKCTREECIRTVAATLNYVMERTEYLTILIETMAGQGNTVGGKFEEIQQIIELVENKKRIGVCLDTCHIFAAGYDIRSEERYKETFAKFDNTIGLQYLRAFHINDSMGELGSKLDRHANVGKGKLKLAAFRNLIIDQRFDGLPMILETPEGDYADEMIRLYNTSSESKPLKAQRDIKSFFSPQQTSP